MRPFIIFATAFIIHLGLLPVLEAKEKEWDVQKGSNFIIYSRDVPEDFVQTVMAQCEEDYQRISQNLGITRYQSWSWEKRASVYIYRDAEDYVNNGAQAGWSHGAALISSKTIKTYPSQSGFFDSVLPHELGHIILHEFIGPQTSVPLWFDEGVAMYQEKARRVGAHGAVRKSKINGQFIPLTQLTDMRLYTNSNDAEVQLFYAESASIVNFMITELGQAHFSRFCQELKRQVPFEEALAKVYISIKTIGDLNKKWVSFLEEE